MNVALTGICGYGDVYLSALIQMAAAEHGVNLVAVVEPQPGHCQRVPELRARGVPVFSSLGEMYAHGTTPELVVLASPLHVHAEQAVLAMETGSHVLCEKPLAATPEDAARMIAARDRTGRALAVGFQWSYAPSVLAMKADIRAGRYGRPLSLRTQVCWPRNRNYYARNGWAGRIKTADGRPVLDSPVNNACAHYIHNMLDLVIDAWDASDWPTTVAAELYRANEIENYDTAVLRCRTAADVELLAAVSHATERTLEPCLDYTFERGKITCDSNIGGGGHIVGVLDDGTEIDYGPPPGANDVEKLWSTIESIRSGRPIVATAESAAAHTALMAAVQRTGKVIDFGPAYVTEREHRRGVCVPGLDAVLDRCYADGRLPSELGAVPWARAGLEAAVDQLTLARIPTDADDAADVAA